MGLYPLSLALLLAAAPQFDVADIHRSTPATNPDTFVSGGLLASGRYDLRRATLLDLIGIAWDTPPAQIFGGPGWLAFDRFDITAKAPLSTSPEAVNAMLRSLLQDRFKLSLHNTTRPIPTYVLTKGQGEPRLKPAEGTGNRGCRTQSQTTTYACRNVTLSLFAASLGFLKVPVVDSTGIEGAWDFDLQLDTRTTIFDAVDKQLGLKLELRQISTPVIVIDGARQHPLPNQPGVEKALPPRSLEFEVAAVKLSPPEERFGFKRYPGGRLELHAFPMKMLIATAWDVDWDHMDERIAGAPKWIDTKRFNIVANAASPSVVPQGTGIIDEDFQLMLRSLLIDRFRIALHFEDRPVPAYTLTSIKPKLTKADPANRAHCGIAPGQPGDIRNRLIQCRNVTMREFAEQLRSMDRVEAAFNDVADDTGLQGAWDFTIAFSTKSMLQTTGDPNGAISLFEAIRQQLGLKLEMQKRPLPVLVIDRIDETPAEN